MGPGSLTSRGAERPTPRARRPGEAPLPGTRRRARPPSGCPGSWAGLPPPRGGERARKIQAESGPSRIQRRGLVLGLRRWRVGLWCLLELPREPRSSWAFLLPPSWVIPDTANRKLFPERLYEPAVSCQGTRESAAGTAHRNTDRLSPARPPGCSGSRASLPPPKRGERTGKIQAVSGPSRIQRRGLVLGLRRWRVGLWCLLELPLEPRSSWAFLLPPSWVIPDTAKRKLFPARI